MKLQRKCEKVPVNKSYFVYEELKRKLMNGKLKLGEKLNINEMCEIYQVSRRPIMDAIKMLENEGFIEIVPQSGCNVINYSKDDFIDLILMSASIESLCAKLAAENHTANEILLLEEYHYKMKNIVLDEKGYQDYIKYNRKIY